MVLACSFMWWVGWGGLGAQAGSHPTPQGPASGQSQWGRTREEAEEEKTRRWDGGMELSTPGRSELLCLQLEDLWAVNYHVEVATPGHSEL